MSRVSIIIPSRSDQWLQQTVDDLFAKAEEDVEAIVVYDGRWASPILRDHPKLIQVHHGIVHNNYGMRASINAGMDLARGEYVMKIDEQCAVDQGYDVKLKADCADDWVVIPRRWRLDAENWKLTTETEDDKRPPVDYMIIDYPYKGADKLKEGEFLPKTEGLHGAAIDLPDRAHVEIDDVMTMQGSCYFMKKSYWGKLFPEGLDDVNYGTFTQEAQEISNKVWLSGGRVAVNKKTWYAHWHKGTKGKGYGFSNEQYRKHLAGTEKGRLYCIDYWLNTTDYLHDFVWLVEKFNPPGWENWQERIKVDRLKDFSQSYKGEGYKPAWG